MEGVGDIVKQVNPPPRRPRGRLGGDWQPRPPPPVGRRRLGWRPPFSPSFFSVLANLGSPCAAAGRRPSGAGSGAPFAESRLARSGSALPRWVLAGVRPFSRLDSTGGRGSSRRGSRPPVAGPPLLGLALWGASASPLHLRSSGRSLCWSPPPWPTLGWPPPCHRAALWWARGRGLLVACPWVLCLRQLGWPLPVAAPPPGRRLTCAILSAALFWWPASGLCCVVAAFLRSSALGRD